MDDYRKAVGLKPFSLARDLHDMRRLEHQYGPFPDIRVLPLNPPVLSFLSGIELFDGAALDDLDASQPDLTVLCPAIDLEAYRDRTAGSDGESDAGAKSETGQLGSYPLLFFNPYEDEVEAAAAAGPDSEGYAAYFEAAETTETDGFEGMAELLERGFGRDVFNDDWEEWRDEQLMIHDELDEGHFGGVECESQ